MPIRRILVAVDGSNPSINASTFAIDLAKRFDAELIVLHVIDPRYRELEMAISPRPGRFKEIEKKVMEDAQKILDTVKVNATAKNVNVTINAISGFTSVVKDIVHYAKVNTADIIIIGNRGITGFKKLLIVSIASGVVKYSDRPVLVVK